jgi:hypothetical protein
MKLTLPLVDSKLTKSSLVNRNPIIKPDQYAVNMRGEPFYYRNLRFDQEVQQSDFEHIELYTR